MLILVNFLVLDEADAFLGERIRGDLKQNSLVSSKNPFPCGVDKCAGSGKHSLLLFSRSQSYCYITAIFFDR
jgi:hypothetical protein